MRKDNTPNYNTPYSRISHFKDYVQKINKIEDELSKLDRQTRTDHDSDYELPNEFTKAYNTVSSKWDEDSKNQLKDKKKAAKSFKGKKPDHKYKFTNDEVNPNHFFHNNTEVVEKRYIKKFENFFGNVGYDQQTPRMNFSLEPVILIDAEEYEMDGCGCCDDCSGNRGCDCCNDCTCDSDYDYDEQYEDNGCCENCCGESGCNCCEKCTCDQDYDYDDEHEDDDYPSCPTASGDVKSYMFFGNLQTIQRLSQELLEYDEAEVNDLLNDGHNWAEDHMSVSKELISHVYNFLVNRSFSEHLSVSGVEHGGGMNYMFFANLENICQMCEGLMELDEEEVDEILENGHDWAEDHIAAAKENIQQVYDWINSEM